MDCRFCCLENKIAMIYVIAMSLISSTEYRLRSRHPGACFVHRKWTTGTDCEHWWTCFHWVFQSLLVMISLMMLNCRNRALSFLIISSVGKEHLMGLRHPLEHGEVYQWALRDRTSVTVKRAKCSNPSSWGGFKVQKCVLSSEFVASSRSTFRWSTGRDRETTQPWEE